MASAGTPLVVPFSEKLAVRGLPDALGDIADITSRRREQQYLRLYSPEAKLRVQRNHGPLRHMDLAPPAPFPAPCRYGDLTAAATQALFEDEGSGGLGQATSENIGESSGAARMEPSPGFLVPEKSAATAGAPKQKPRLMEASASLPTLYGRQLLEPKQIRPPKPRRRRAPPVNKAFECHLSKEEQERRFKEFFQDTEG